MTEIHVLLTDDDDRTALIACPDGATAEQVGSAAVYSDGGVSAWRVPSEALVYHPSVVDILHEGGDCDTLHADPDLLRRETVTLAKDDFDVIFDALWAANHVTNDSIPESIIKEQQAWAAIQKYRQT